MKLFLVIVVIIARVNVNAVIYCCLYDHVIEFDVSYGQQGHNNSGLHIMHNIIYMLWFYQWYSEQKVIVVIIAQINFNTIISIVAVHVRLI